MKAISAALLAGIVGCAFVQPTSAADTAKFSERVVYSFCSKRNCRDGELPAALIDVNGTLFGTTVEGGRTGCVPYNGCGTVFSLVPRTGAEKVLYSFCGRPNCADGESPDASLIYLNGTLYGVTFMGGTGVSGLQYGTAFALDPNTGAETVLYSFCSQQNCSDGSSPTSLIAESGTLYGTTETGGTGDNSPCPGCGTAFSLNPNTGTEKVLYSFCSQPNCTDGSNPDPAMIYVNGTLYGTTPGGGAYVCDGNQACGTAYSLDPNTGAETVLHSFGNGSDGKSPEASLFVVNGKLYGTTYEGGVTGCGGSGCGTVFSVDPNSGAEKVLYSFCSQANCADGANPFASLVYVNGTLYGTTNNGAGTGCNGAGCGTVFSIDPSTGTEKVVYSFCSQSSCADGANPYNLIAVNGRFYGTTSAGGANNAGTVFELKKELWASTSHNRIQGSKR